MPTLIPGELRIYGTLLLIQLTRQSEMSDDQFALRGAPAEERFAPY